ncbi:MAG TPA: hypothetical protein VEL76_27010 [Gemmataceae bacterium]|nr:hypothetical protein [Gemmataceae bacterium]
MRYWILPWLVLLLGMTIELSRAVKAAQKPEPTLKQQLDAADLVVLAKVVQTGLSTASSFDVGVLEVREVLKGDAKTKTAHFRFVSSGGGQVAPYGKKGVDGVWLLGKKGGYLESRQVLLFLPPQELKAVKAALTKPRQEKEP